MMVSSSGRLVTREAPPNRSDGPAGEHGDSMGRLNQTAGGIHLDLEGLGPEVRPATVEFALGHESFEPLESLRGSRIRALGFILHNQPCKKSRGPRSREGRGLGASRWRNIGRRKQT